MEVEQMPPEQPDKVCPEKVVVHGPGITNAFCGEEAEFTVDGSVAGPGNWLCVFTVKLSTINGGVSRKRHDIKNLRSLTIANFILSLSVTRANSA